MTLRIRFGRPAAPVARKACPHCENRRALFRAEGIRKWDPYYALCYRCYQRYVSRAPFDHAQGRPERSRGTQAQPVPPAAAASPAGHPGRTLALETGLMPAR